MNSLPNIKLHIDSEFYHSSYLTKGIHNIQNLNYSEFYHWD